MIGRPIAVLAAPGRENEMPAILERIRRGERVDHFDTVRRRKDGTLVEVSLTVSPVRDEAGRIVGASKIARDITERRRAEQERELRFGELRHRVKNLLAMVQALARQTGTEGRSGEQYRDDLPGPARGARGRARAGVRGGGQRRPGHARRAHPGALRGRPRGGDGRGRAGR